MFYSLVFCVDSIYTHISIYYVSIIYLFLFVQDAQHTRANMRMTLQGRGALSIPFSLSVVINTGAGC